jgi:hypothetical protein
MFQPILFAIAAKYFVAFGYFTGGNEAYGIFGKTSG